MAYLHGIEIIEVDSGGRTITTQSTSVIGLNIFSWWSFSNFSHKNVNT